MLAETRCASTREAVRADQEDDETKKRRAKRVTTLACAGEVGRALASVVAKARIECTAATVAAIQLLYPSNAADFPNPPMPQIPEEQVTLVVSKT